MMLWDVMLGAIATWRISHMLLNENGPFSVFRYARGLLGVTYDLEEEDRILSAKYEITICIWCLSMWIGALITLGLFLFPGVFVWFLLPYVFSAFAASWNHWHDAFGMKK